MTDDEARLAAALGLPIYGSDPALNRLGTKSAAAESSRTKASHIPPASSSTANGSSRGQCRAAHAAALGAGGGAEAEPGGERSRQRAHRPRRAGDDPRSALRLEDPELDVEEYLSALADEGGIVEERIEGADFRSPSVQLRMSPAGQVDIMSTHDQVLGGPHGQTYFGCHFPPTRSTPRGSPPRL